MTLAAAARAQRWRSDFPGRPSKWTVQPPVPADRVELALLDRRKYFAAQTCFAVKAGRVGEAKTAGENEAYERQFMNGRFISGAFSLRCSTRERLMNI